MDIIMTTITKHFCFTPITGDRTRTKLLLRRLKNIGMASEKLYRNTLSNSIIFSI